MPEQALTIVVAVDLGDGPLHSLGELAAVLLLALDAEAAALSVLGYADVDGCLRQGLHDRTPVPPMPQYPLGFFERYCWW